MPQLQSVVLTDRESTPVDHTFTPSDIVSGVATVTETDGVPIGNSRLTISLRKPGPNGSSRYKSDLKLAIPVVVNETINGVTVPKVARTAYADVTFTFDSTSSEEERDNLVGMLASALEPTKVLVNDTVVKLQAVF